MLSLLFQQPGRQVRLRISLIPGVVTDAGILGVLHISVRSFQSFGHFARLCDWYGLVGISVENPDRSLANAVRSFGVGVGHSGIVDQADVQLRKSFRSANTGTNRNIGGEAAGIFRS